MFRFNSTLIAYRPRRRALQLTLFYDLARRLRQRAKPVPLLPPNRVTGEGEGGRGRLLWLPLLLSPYLSNYSWESEWASDSEGLWVFVCMRERERDTSCLLCLLFSSLVCRDCTLFVVLVCLLLWC